MTTNGELFQTTRRRETSQNLDEQFPFYPLNSPGMPVPGDNFVANAIALGDPAPTLSGKGTNTRLEQWGPQLEYLYRRALYDERFTLAVTTRGGQKMANLVPGHLLGDETAQCAGGPRPARIMILGKNPGRDEIEARRNFVGPSSQILFDAFAELGVGDEQFGFYVDNIVHWAPVEDGDTLPAAHKKDCEILLQQTLRLVRPEYLLCLGSDASKWVLGPAYGVSSMVGRMQEIIIPVNFPGEPPQYHTIKVMAATHPAAVHRTPELYPEFRAAVGSFIAATNGTPIGGRETFIRHINVYKHRHLKRIVDEIVNDPNPLRRIIAVDGEWEGDNPGEPGSYLRTVQFSTAHGEGICVVLRHQGGSPAFQPSIEHAIHELKRLCKRNGDYKPRIGGHILRADLPWLIHAGLDLREEYAPPENLEECRDAGGWETSLMYHAYNETASFRLTDMMVRLTTAPVYDTVLKDHITEYCRVHDIGKDDLEGYGFLPDWILHPEPADPEWGNNYAPYDADVTRRVCMKHYQPGGLLDSDWHGNSSWEPYWRSHRASLGVLQMEMHGLTVDNNRVDRLTTIYMEVKERLLRNFRQQIRWDTFNPESPQHCVAILFGDHYVNKRDKTTGQLVNIRPPGSVCLGLTPVKTTGRRSKLWADVCSRGEQAAHSPSTDKEVLGILGHATPLAMQLRDLKFITQILKGPLRPPIASEDGVGWNQTEEGNLEYAKGLAACACVDGRVHTHISQLLETGRSASARPPLQNISSRRESDYARILGKYSTDKATGLRTAKGDYTSVFEPSYLAPIRTIFRATPGYVLIEADYTGAELAVIAWLSGDRNMIEHVRRNILPEDHPDHYDIHSHTAVDTFQLACAPTKKGLKDAGHGSLRVAAKNVNFGIPYGRSAEAIARQCKEEGVDVSEADCQLMIDGYFVRYPGTAAFLEACESRSQEERFLVGSYGRRRRFISTRDRGVIGEQKRQARNFPIQNCVADAMWTAIYNFWKYRQDHQECGYRMLLQIHDAALFEVPIPQAKHFIDHILPLCMVQNVPIWPRFLDGTPMPVAQPYHFGIDTKIQINWGEDLTEEMAARYGLDVSLVA